MPDPSPRRTNLIAVVLTISAIGSAVGFGLCGLGVAATGSARLASQIAIYGGASLFVVSLSTLLITALIALVKWFIKVSRK